MTYLQLVNATLRRLRRQEVTSVSSTSYSKLIGDHVNLAKREVEDAWNWLDLMTETSVSVTSGTDTYTLSSYGERYQIHQVHDTTQTGRVRPITQKRFREYEDLATGTTGTLNNWRISGYSGGDPQIQFWPSPSASATVKVYAKVCQSDLSANTDSLTIPDYPVLTGAYARALDERGEDGGTTSQRAVADYRQALSDAISQDNANRAHGVESDWMVV